MQNGVNTPVDEEVPWHSASDWHATPHADRQVGHTVTQVYPQSQFESFVQLSP